MFLDEFKGNPTIKLYHSETKSSFSLISFNIENIEAEEAAFILANSFSILVRGGLHCAPLIHK
jgi:selenocysteine lyase/cysteine desulfurase